MKKNEIDSGTTIRSIARLANVSPSTVSKALNDRPDISDATREKILEIARRNNYYSNAHTRLLRNAERLNIGVFFSSEESPFAENPFYTRVLEGVEAELAINNHNLILKVIQSEESIIVPRILTERQISGVVLIGSFPEWIFNSIAEKRIPSIFVDPQCNHTSGTQILIDNEHGAFLATQYLIKKGHQKIGFISGDLNRLSFQQRYKGYLKALEYNQIEVDDQLILTGGVEDGYEQTKTLLDLHKATAIFAVNDMNALQCYRAIHEQGLSIPIDISVIGFDDIGISRYAAPPLTTIHVYKEELGSIAVRKLISNLESQNTNSENTIIPVKLIERESVEPLNGRVRKEVL